MILHEAFRFVFQRIPSFFARDVCLMTPREKPSPVPRLLASLRRAHERHRRARPSVVSVLS